MTDPEDNVHNGSPNQENKTATREDWCIVVRLVCTECKQITQTLEIPMLLPTMCCLDPMSSVREHPTTCHECFMRSQCVLRGKGYKCWSNYKCHHNNARER